MSVFTDMKVFYINGVSYGSTGKIMFQLADKVKIKITIAEDVPCGLYDLRLQSAKGLSNK